MSLFLICVAAVLVACYGLCRVTALGTQAPVLDGMTPDEMARPQVFDRCESCGELRPASALAIDGTCRGGCGRKVAA